MIWPHTIQLRLLAVLVVSTILAEASVIFPRSNENVRRYRYGNTKSTRNTGEFTLRKARQRNRSIVPGSSFFQGSSVRGPKLAFTPIQSGGAAILLAAVAYIGQILTTESVKRAMYFWAHAGPIVIHYKFTRWYLGQTKAPLKKRDRVYNELHDRYCQKSLDIALHLKGLYAKIAQVVSSRPDFVPPQYIELFSTVQDAIPQWPIDAVTEILDRTLTSEFGLKCDDVFESIDAEALGSASIGQVHSANLRDDFASKHSRGEKVVAIKVMHPGAEDRFSYDFQVFRWLCKVALSGWEPILDEFYRQIMTEFDYRREAASLRKVYDDMNESRFCRLVKIPEPMQSLCTKELLVMELLHGKKLSDAIEDDLATALGGSKSDALELIKRKRLGKRTKRVRAKTSRQNSNSCVP